MFFREASHSAVYIVYGGTEPAADEVGEHGVADVLVGPWHRTGKYSAAASGKAATLSEITPLTKCFEELRQFEEVVAVVGIGHEDVRRSGGFHP